MNDYKKVQDLRYAAMGVITYDTNVSDRGYVCNLTFELGDYADPSPSYLKQEVNRVRGSLFFPNEHRFHKDRS